MRAAYVAIGILLGAAAPAGALLIRMVLDASIRADPLAEVRANSFFYLYSLIGTSIVFALAGWFAGSYAEKLRAAEAFYRRLADHDPLTGLLNPRSFEDHYERAIERSAKLREPMALLLLDVDLLKGINDQHGHTRGSAALVRVAEAIQASKRASDEAARWGGDEFVILQPSGEESSAIRTAEAIRSWLAEHPVLPPPPISVTVTIGVAAGIPTAASSDFFGAADKALYAGKRSGRDQVRAATFP